MSGLLSRLRALFGGKAEDGGPVQPPPLRCKPGDVCLVVRNAWFHEARVMTGNPYVAPGARFITLKAGTVVRVTRNDGEFWQFEKPVPYSATINGRHYCGKVTGAADFLLQPLPGLEAEDCTTHDAYKPQPVEAA